MLLNVVRGPQSYEEIRTVDGVLHLTFQEACNELGLLDNDKEWDEALQEASIWATPSQLRNLFATIIIFCEVADSLSLWEKHWQPMSEDISHHLQNVFNLQHYHVPE